MKKRLLQSVVFTAAAVILGLSSLAGEKLRGDRRRSAPEKK